MYDLARIDDADVVKEAIEPLGRGGFRAGEYVSLDRLGEMRQRVRRQRHATQRLLGLFAKDHVTATAFLQLAVNLESLRQAHSCGREQPDQYLIALVESIKVALHILNVGLVEWQTRFFVVALWNDAGKRIEFQAALLMARFTAALSHPIFFWIVALLICWYSSKYS